MGPGDSPPTDTDSPGGRAVGPGLLDIYGQLRAIAQQMMAGERPGHTLEATALVHEAVIRLSRRSDIPHNDRSKWLGAAADEMRRALIDHARKKQAVKRRPPTGKAGFDLASVRPLFESPDSDLIMALDSAIVRLEGVSPRAADVVRLRFFLGLSVDETAKGLGQSRRTVLRDWEFARAFLAAEIGAS